MCPMPGYPSPTLGTVFSIPKYYSLRTPSNGITPCPPHLHCRRWRRWHRPSFHIYTFISCSTLLSIALAVHYTTSGVPFHTVITLRYAKSLQLARCIFRRCRGEVVNAVIVEISVF